MADSSADHGSKGGARRQLTPDDATTLAARGISVAEAQRQLALLADPPPAIELDRPCTVGDGIVRLRDDEHPGLLERFAAAASGGRFSRFVPASGAASRMFQQLSRCASGDDDGEDAQALERFFTELHRFAFAEDLRRAVEAAGRDFETARRSRDRQVLRTLLDDDGLGYRHLPKGLIPFHRDADSPAATGRTAIEEHLRESAETLTSASSEETPGGPPCRIHFTVPGHQQELCRRVFDALAHRLERETGTPYDISFSVQAPDTDTLALDDAGRPFRDASGDLLFRPGGHGALIANLRGWATAPGVDLVYIKNIDNIQPAAGRAVAVHWKRLLGGYLLELESQVVPIVDGCRDGSLDGSALDDALDFVCHRLAAPRPDGWAQWTVDGRRKHLVERLERPLRVCGVVVNQGEPGGGPFWVRHRTDDGSSRTSLQIVETSQIDVSVDQQADILAAASHFNPVDIVCRLRSADGNVFDLPSFVDPDTVFVSRKSQHGRPLVALERPGLWNGAMARWNTVFVEVPAATFAPVKTVFDLLRPEHRA